MDKMIALYKRLLKLEKCTFARIEHEDAIVAIVYKVTQQNGAQFILKICERPQDYIRELYFLKYFSTILPVAKIIDVVEPGAEIHSAILMHCFPGTILRADELTDQLAYELGSLLAAIHLNRTTAYGDLIEPAALNLDPRIYFTFKFEEGLMECADHLPKALLEQSRNYYDAHIDLLLSVDGPCIIHRDFRPGNIMVHNGMLQGIIDWASGRSGFAEDDFCPWELDEWSNNLTDKKTFLRGYASVRPLPDYEAIMPFLRLNRAIATIGFTVKRGTWDNSSSRLYQINRHFLENFVKMLS